MFVFIFRELHALKVNTVARFEAPVVNTRHMERVSALVVMGCHSSLASSKDDCRLMPGYNSTIVPLHHRRWERIHLAYELASDSEVFRRHDTYIHVEIHNFSIEKSSEIYLYRYWKCSNWLKILRTFSLFKLRDWGVLMF